MEYTDIVSELADLRTQVNLIDTQLAIVRRQLLREQVDASTALQSYSVGPDKLAPVPSATLQRVAVQTIPTSAWTAVTWDTVPGASAFAVGVPRTALTAPFAGTYIVTANVDFDTNPTGSRAVRLLANGARVSESFGPAAASQPSARSVACCVRLQVGQSVTVEAFQDYGAPLNLVSANLVLAWVGN